MLLKRKDIMHYIDLIIATPLGYIMNFCYTLVKSYGWAIILFTLIVKLLTLPIAVKVQKNSIKMVKMKPLIDELKRKYPHKQDKEQFMEEQIKLFDREKYSPAMGCFPMLIQIPVIIGLISVIYNPLKHLLKFNQETIDILYAKTMELLQLNELNFTADALVMETIKNPAFTNEYSGIVNENVINQILNFQTFFLGMNLSITPTFNSVLIAIPLISAASAFVLCVLQNKENVLQIEQGKLNQWGMTVFLTLFSLYFAFIVPAGVGLYWIFSNIFAIMQLYLLNQIYDPKKYIDYEHLNKSKEMNLQLNKIKKAEKEELKKFKPREKSDYKKFLNMEDKELVFYSEKSGFYKYFQNVIEEVIKRSDITIHYITSDPNDAIFARKEPQIIPYYIGEHKLIPLMMRMDADVVVMTMPDLEQFHIKRSKVRKDVEYVFMPHWMTSVSMVVREGAVDYFDTIFCVGQHWIDEIRATEEVYKLRKKNLVNYGYGIIENLVKMYDEANTQQEVSFNAPQILIAPSWQEDNIMDTCLDSLLFELINKDYRIVVRPHPEYIKRNPNRISDFKKKYNENFSDNFILEEDFSSNATVFKSDLIITDWSTIAHEFSYATKRPSLFINTPMKIMNPNYDKIKIEPLDITLRNLIGKSVDIKEIGKINKYIDEMLIDKVQYKETIETIVDKYVFNFGKSGFVGAEYLMDRINCKPKESEK